MRLMIAGIVFGLLAVAPAKAQNLPWCMIDSLKTGATTCAFVSYEQCQVSARGGNIGHCVRNPNLREPEPPLVRRRGG